MCDLSLSVIVGAIFFFKQKTAYEMRISYWSSDVCSSDLDRKDAVGSELLVGLGRDELAFRGEQLVLGVQDVQQGALGHFELLLVGTQGRAVEVAGVFQRFDEIGRAHV